MLLIHTLPHWYIVTWLNIHMTKYCVKRETTTPSHGVNARLHGHLGAQIALLLLARCHAHVAVDQLGGHARAPPLHLRQRVHHARFVAARRMSLDPANV